MMSGPGEVASSTSASRRDEPDRAAFRVLGAVRIAAAASRRRRRLRSASCSRRSSSWHSAEQ